MTLVMFCRVGKCAQVSIKSKGSLLGEACSGTAWGVHTSNPPVQEPCMGTGWSIQRQQIWLERNHNSRRHVHARPYVETLSQKKNLVKEENVLKDRWLSREESAALSRGTCQG